MADCVDLFTDEKKEVNKESIERVSNDFFRISIYLIAPYSLVVLAMLSNIQNEVILTSTQTHSYQTF